MFGRSSPEIQRKAELLGGQLLEAVPEIAKEMASTLQAQHRIGFRYRNGPDRFLLELLVLSMHILDRMAFERLGRSGRDIFVDRLITVVMGGVIARSKSGVSAVDFVAELRDTYNRRQAEYSRYKALAPQPGAPPQGTLFWEFSKTLFGLLNDENPASLVLLTIMVTECMMILLDNVMDAKRVLA